jgi:hypothetical protein
MYFLELTAGEGSNNLKKTDARLLKKSCSNFIKRLFIELYIKEGGIFKDI